MKKQLFLLEQGELSVYKNMGYRDREDYLQCMSEDYEVALEDVYNIADLLGASEDFDGLVVALEDFKMFYDDYDSDF